MITVNGVDYPTQESLKRAVRVFTNSFPNISAWPSLIQATQQPFWNSLMAFNCRTQAKIDDLPGDYAGFAYQQNPDKPIVEAVLGVMDKEGNFRSLSWHSAIKEAFKPGTSKTYKKLISDIKWGFRRAIRDQIAEERGKKLRNGRILCEATGEWCQAQDIHMDHYPITFDRLANQFLERLPELNYEMIHQTHIDDPMHCRFKDTELDAMWQQYHKDRAELRPLEKGYHLALSRGGTSQASAPGP